VDQRNYNDKVSVIINANEPHIACLLLLDSSESMSGEPIEELNAALNKFKLGVFQDKTTRDVLDIAIVEFNDNPNVIQEFLPFESMKPVNLSAGGGTNMEPAISLAIDMVKERLKFYQKTRTKPFKPWIIMVSDGFGGSVDNIASTIRDMEEKQMLKFFSLGVEGYDPKVLHQLSGEKVTSLKGFDFTDLFSWIPGPRKRSIPVCSPSEKPKGVPLLSNIDKDTDDWI